MAPSFGSLDWELAHIFFLFRMRCFGIIAWETFAGSVCLETFAGGMLLIPLQRHVPLDTLSLCTCLVYLLGTFARNSEAGAPGLRGWGKPTCWESSEAKVAACPLRQNLARRRKCTSMSLTRCLLSLGYVAVDPTRRKTAADHHVRVTEAGVRRSRVGRRL